MEQATRLNNLRIFKLEEREGGNLNDRAINLFDSELQTTLRNKDILFCKRIVGENNRKPTGVLLKLSSLSVKMSIYNRKQMLKGTGVVVKKDLSDNRLKLLECAMEKASLRRVWTQMGSIFVFKDTKRLKINNKHDLDKL
nr:unnamed protein product [Callosobruchus analis]